MAHERLPLPERRGSANSLAPSATLSDVSGLSGEEGGGAGGRFNLAFQSASISLPWVSCASSAGARLASSSPASVAIATALEPALLRDMLFDP